MGGAVFPVSAPGIWVPQNQRSRGRRPNDSQAGPRYHRNHLPAAYPGAYAGTFRGNLAPRDKPKWGPVDEYGSDANPTTAGRRSQEGRLRIVVLGLRKAGLIRCPHGLNGVSDVATTTGHCRFCPPWHAFWRVWCLRFRWMAAAVLAGAFAVVRKEQ